MKVVADQDLCIGAGVCVMSTAVVFDQDDDGIVVVLTGTSPRPKRTGPARECSCAPQERCGCPSDAATAGLRATTAARTNTAGFNNESGEWVRLPTAATRSATF